MTAQEMVVKMGSFACVNQVIRFLYNQGLTITGFSDLTISTLDHGDVKLIEKNGRVYAM